MKTRLKKNTFNIWVAVLGVLVIFASVLAFTGGWFTDSKVIKGNLNAPAIKPYIVEKNGSTYTKIAQDTLEWSSSADSKSVYIQFPADENNVKYELVRFSVSVTWGTKVDGEFVEDSELPNENEGAIALTPTIANSNDWTRGEATLEYVAEQIGYTVEQLQEFCEQNNTTVDDLIAFFGVNTTNVSALYYYNNIVVLADQTSPLQIISGFTFSGSSKYTGKVAKIKIMADAASVGDQTLGGTQDGTPYKGEWTSDNNIYRATDAWVMSIKGKRKTLLGF